MQCTLSEADTPSFYSVAFEGTGPAFSLLRLMKVTLHVRASWRSPTPADGAL